MATRNLTKKLVDIRNAAKANRTLRIRGDDGSEESDSGLLRVMMASKSRNDPFKCISSSNPFLPIFRLYHSKEEQKPQIGKLSKIRYHLYGLI